MSENKAPTILTPGTYRLRADLPALRDDKRRSRDWRYCPMKAGTLFFYKEWTYSPSDDETRLYTEQRLYPVGQYEHDSVRPNESSRTRQLEGMLIPVVDTPSNWLRREHNAGGTALDALDQLVVDGKITLADVQRATERYLERIE